MIKCSIDVMLTKTTYLLQETYGTTQTQGDESLDGENEDTMSTIRSRIADALVETRGR